MTDMGQDHEKAYLVRVNHLSVEYPFVEVR